MCDLESYDSKPNISTVFIRGDLKLLHDSVHTGVDWCDCHRDLKSVGRILPSRNFI